MIGPHGTIESTSIALPAKLRDAARSRVQHVWRPSDELQPLGPANFSLTLVSTTDWSGIRRFQPGDWQAFPILAACGGLAIRQAISDDIDPERIFAYRISLLIFQLHARLRSTLTRVFFRSKDLYISRKASEDGSPHIIPEDLAVPATNESTHPNPGDVIDFGVTLARQSGLQDADDATHIRLALDEAAKHQPVTVEDLSEEELRRNVRLGLFDLGPAEHEITDEIRNEVFAHFTESLEKHIDLSTDEFNTWFFEKFDNIVKQLSERKQRKGTVNRQQVRQVVLEQIFESYVHLADLIEAQMRAFAADLPNPLSGEEAEIYEALFYRKGWLGGLSVAMLARQFPLLRSLLAELIASPADQELQGAILKRLQTNAEMISRKRAADARDRRRQRAGVGSQVDLAEPAAQPESLSLLQGIAAEFRERRGRECACGSWTNWHADEFALHDEELPSSSVSWRDGCAACQRVEDVTVSRDDFAETGRMLVDLS